VYGFKLSVDQPRVYQGREGLIVQEFLQVGQRLMHFIDGRRDKRRLRQRGIGWSNPILRSTKLAGKPMPPTHALQKLPMDLPKETEG